MGFTLHAMLCLTCISIHLLLFFLLHFSKPREPNQEKKPLVSRRLYLQYVRICVHLSVGSTSAVCVWGSLHVHVSPPGEESHVCIVRRRVPCCHYTSVHDIPYGWALLHLWLLRLRSIPFGAFWEKKHPVPEHSPQATPCQVPAGPSAAVSSGSSAAVSSGPSAAVSSGPSAAVGAPGCATQGRYHHRRARLLSRGPLTIALW